MDQRWRDGFSSRSSATTEMLWPATVRLAHRIAFATEGLASSMLELASRAPLSGFDDPTAKPVTSLDADLSADWKRIWMVSAEYLIEEESCRFKKDSIGGFLASIPSRSQDSVSHPPTNKRPPQVK